MTRNKLYTIVILACMTGWAWIKFNTASTSAPAETTVCIFKHVTNVPCPSCGTTRSVVTLMEGDVMEAFLTNPFGLLVATFILVGPPWIIWDLLTGNKTFMLWYERAESFIRQKKVAIVLIGLVVANWIWNIFKAL